MRKQRLFVGNPVVHMTELRAVTKPCIAALFCARSFFQHDDLGPGVVGRDGRGLSCITETDDDHVQFSVFISSLGFLYHNEFNAISRDAAYVISATETCK